MTYVSQNLPLQQSSWALFFSQLGVKARSICSEINARRRMKATLGKLSARELRDVGLTKNDVTSIGDLPLPSSSVLMLSQKAKSRTGNW